MEEYRKYCRLFASRPKREVGKPRKKGLRERREEIYCRYGNMIGTSVI